METRRPRASKNPLRFLGEHPEFNSREVAQRDGRTHVVCISDSHINERLSEMCASVPATFVDVTSEQLDPETGIVASSLINPKASDHHLSQPAYAEIVARKLGPALKPA